MTDDPISLDEHRGMAARQATELRRRHSRIKDDQEALRLRQAELERLLAAPAATWREAAMKARYLIKLFADTVEGRDLTRKKLISDFLADLERLADKDAGPITPR
jgi:hypothetical protein